MCRVVILGYYALVCSFLCGVRLLSVTSNDADKEIRAADVISLEKKGAVDETTKKDKRFHIGPCFILKQLCSKQNEADNFRLLEILLGSEEKEQEEEVDDPDWTFLDENVGVTVDVGGMSGD